MFRTHAHDCAYVLTLSHTHTRILSYSLTHLCSCSLQTQIPAIWWWRRASAHTFYHPYLSHRVMLPELDFSFLMRTPIPGFARPSYEQDLTRLRACACTCFTCAHTSAHIHAHLHAHMHAYAHIHAHIHAHTRADPHPIPSSHSFRPRKWRFVLEDLHIGGRGLAGEEAHVANEVSIRCIGCARVRACVCKTALARGY